MRLRISFIDETKEPPIAQFVEYVLPPGATEVSSHEFGRLWLEPGWSNIMAEVNKQIRSRADA